MAKNKLKLGVSFITKKVYADRYIKEKGNGLREMSSRKEDITQEFLCAMVDLLHQYQEDNKVLSVETADKEFIIEMKTRDK